jgi:prenylcysteine oxidase/farnesylcysteine lyase
MHDPDFGETGLGIWDGAAFLFRTSTSRSRAAGWWDALAALRRYGPLAPYRTRGAVRALLLKFADLYDGAWLARRGATRSVAEFAGAAGLGAGLVDRRADAWALDDVRADARWVAEIMEGSTRVNYAADMSGIHALGAAVSMAASGARAVQGGNWRIFAGMLGEAGAVLRLGTQVGGRPRQSACARTR